MPFDPSLPFQLVNESASSSGFDPGKPFEVVPPSRDPEVIKPVKDELGIGEEIRGVGRGLARGARRAVQTGDVVGMRRVPQLEDELKKAEADLAKFDTDFPGRTQERWRMDQVSRIANIKGELDRSRQMAPELAESFTKQQAAIEKLPLTEAQKKFNDPNTPWWNFFSNPVELAAIATAESVPQMAGTVIGAAGGPAGIAAAAGATSHASESAARVAGAMQEQGVDLKDPQAVLSWFTNRAKADPALAKADLAAMGPAAFDALTGGIAGRWLGRALGTGVRPVAAATAKEIGTQMAGGGAGSIVGSVLAGEKIDWKDVVLEMAAELAPVETVSNVRSELRGQRLSRARKIVGEEPATTAPAPASPVTVPDAGAAIPPSTPQANEIVQTPEETIVTPAAVEQAPEPVARVEDEVLTPTAATAGTASTGQTSFHPYQIAREAEVAPVEEKVESMIDTTKYPVKRVNPRELQLSAEVPNFKGGASLETGEVTPIEGESYDYRDTGAVQVWVRLDGRREIISGRHRWNQALRANAEIPVQEHLESEGFTANHARILDAELNIRDGQGEVSDYANYFRNTRQQYPDEAAARERNLLRSAKGRAGWHLGHNASDDLYALWAAGRITEPRAIAIASTAPGDANLQRFGIKSAQEGADAGQIVSRIEAARSYVATPAAKSAQRGLFDDTPEWAALEEQFKREGDYVAAQRKDLQDIITTRSAVLRRFDVATSSGSIRANAKKAQRELDTAQSMMRRWENWPTDPELSAQVKAATMAKESHNNAIVMPANPVTPPSAPYNETGANQPVSSPRPNTGTGDMFGATVPTKSPEQLAEEKRLAEQQAAIAQGQAKPLTGAVDTSMDMFENNTGDTPLLSQNPNLPGGTQGSIAEVPTAPGEDVQAVGADAIRELIRRPEANLPVFVVRVIEAMLDTPVMRNLDWGRLGLAVRSRLDGNWSGSADVLNSLIEISRTADATTFPHEVFHFLFEMLPTDDRLTVDALRREAITNFPREGLSADARAVLDKLDRGETLFSDDFTRDLPREIYPLINPSEFLAGMAGETFAANVFNSRSRGAIGQLIDRLKGFIQGVIDSLRRVFGARPSLDQIYRELLAGKHEKTLLDTVVAYANRKQGSFSQDAEAARNAEALAQTNEQREVEATHQLAQSRDIVEVLGKHGAGTVGPASSVLLGFPDYLGIEAAGRRLNGGIREGYRQLKARITDPFRRNWLARMAHQQWAILERRLKDVIEQRNEEFTKLTRPSSLRLFVREAAARNRALNSENVLRITQSIFHSAITMARKALTQEGKSDLEIATIEGELNALDDAAKSSVAMQQLLNDMVAVLASTPEGLRALDDPTFGTRKQIKAIYVDVKRTVDPTANLHKTTLLNWASYILHKSKELRETLLAAQYASQSPVRAAMGPYETKFLADFEKDPVKTIKREIRTQSKLATDAQKAAFAWRILHREVTERLEAFAVLDDAAAVAGNVLADPDVASLRTEIRDDAKVLGSLDPAKPFTKNTLLLPDGTEVEIDPDKIVGSKTEFARVHAGFEAAIAKLQAWLNNPANAGDLNYRMHERNLATIEDYFAGLAIQQPNDPLRVIKRSFEIVRNAVAIAGGRVAAQVRVSLARLDNDSRQAAWWTQRYTNRLAESAQRAIRSHGIKYSAFGDTSVHDANRLWYDRVGNQLAYSYNRSAGALKVGDVLASGEKVTQEDIDHLRLMSEAISKGFDIVGERQMTQDTLGGFTTFRRALKGNPLMTIRVFNDDLANFSRDFLEKREAYLEAVRAGTGAAAAEAEMLAVLDIYFNRIGTAFTWDRNPEFSRATVFDGPGGAFETLAARMASNPRLVTNTAEYFDALASLSSLTPDEVKPIILNEWGRIIEAWNREAVQAESPDVPRAGETKNSFTRSRNDAIAPYVFYENGFRNSHSVQKFGSGIQSRAMDEVVAGLDALLLDLDRQQKEFADRVARTAGAPKAAERKVRSRQAIERANGESFDNFEDLDRRKKLVRDARDLMADKTNDTDVDVTFGRYVGALTGMLIGTAATARNVTSGPRYIGQLSRRLNASNLRSNPLAMWHGWLNMPVRLIASLAYGVPKAALFDLPVGAGRAIAGLTDPQRRNVEAFIHTLFRGVIQELGENVYMRISEVKRMIDAGVHFVPDSVAEWDNKLLGTWLTHGLILENDLSTIDKLLQTPVALVETLVLSFQKTLMPMFGDTGLNMATSMLLNSKFGPFQQLERTLRRVYADYKARGYRAFDFTNPRSDANVLSHQEMFPRGIRAMRVSSSARDMHNLREQFEAAGMNFDEKAAEFLAKLDAGTVDAQFLTPAERDAMVNAAIDYTNRASLTNNPINLRRKNFINNLVKPFMFWKVRTLSNFLNDLSTSVRTDKRVRDPGQLFRARAMQVAVVATMVLLPLLFWGAMTNAGDEEANRRLKLALFNQITGFRQPWEREGGESQARGWLVHAFNGVPFLDMAMNTMFNDMPNRASFDPSLAAVEKAKDTARYIGGVVQTGDITHKLPQLIGGLFPDTKMVLGRLESQSGLRDINNVAALATRHGPTELLRPQRTGASGGTMANELTPFADRMVNAAAAGNFEEFRTVYEEAVQTARDMGRTDPEKAVGQMFRSRNPYSRALTAEMTPQQRESFLSRLSPEERARVQRVEDNLTQAGQMIGASVSFVSGDEPQRVASRTASAGTGRVSARTSRLARAGRVRTGLRRGRGPRTRLARAGRRRRGFARLSRAPRLA